MATFIELWYVKIWKMLHGENVSFICCHVKLDEEEQVTEIEYDELISELDNKKIALETWIKTYKPTPEEEEKLWEIFEQQYE